MLENILKSRFFSVTATIIAIVSFVILINSKRTYEAEVDVLILPKDEKVAADIEQIMATAQKIPLTLDFYDRIIDNNPEIFDPSEELAGYKRRAFWNSKIKTQRENGSEIIKIRIFNNDLFQAETIALQTAEELAQTLAFYYDIRTELDVRIVDGPILGYAVETHWVTLLLTSLAIGILAGLLNFWITSFFPEKGSKKKTDFNLPGLSDLARMELDKKDKKTEFKFTDGYEQIKFQPANEKIIFKETEKAPEAPMPNYTKKAPAPANLPVAAEKSAHQSGKITPEEAKEKLNELLRGEL